MARMGLVHVASFVRELDGQCTLLSISGDRLVAGSRQGDIACWSITSGSEIWRSKVDGPCSDSDTNDKTLFFTESDKIHAVDLATGEFLWSIDLEGSTDFVRFTGSGIWATSSVYNIEIQDYYEATVWLIDVEGSVLEKWGIEGRAWSLASTQEEAIVGLSRPKCGYAVVSSESGPEYFPLGNDSPVTMGVVSDGGILYLGHSDGGISEISEEGISTHPAGPSAITSLYVSDDWVAGMDSGRVSSGERLGGWSIDLGGLVDLVIMGPSSKGDVCVWSSSWTEESKLALLNKKSGEVDFELFHGPRIEVGFSTDRAIALGDSRGNIFLIEQDVLLRRLQQIDEGEDYDERKSLLRRRIRNLRRE